ncbi:MAG: hypothetical protein CEO21_408, partial [Microgenomates group bacterium Gr01-1014_80]
SIYDVDAGIYGFINRKTWRVLRYFSTSVEEEYYIIVRASEASRELLKT